MSEFQHISEVLPRVMERLDQIYQNTLEREKPFLDLDEASKYLSRSKHTLYTFCSRGKIPHFKSGRKLYFSKDELDSWVLNQGNRFMSNAEIETEAATRVVTQRGTR